MAGFCCNFTNHAHPPRRPSRPAGNRLDLQRVDPRPDGDGRSRAGQRRRSPASGLPTSIRPGGRSGCYCADGSPTPRAWLSLRSFYGRPAYDETVEVGIYTAPGRPAPGLRPGTARTMRSTRRRRFASRTLLAFTFAHNAPSLGAVSKPPASATWGTLPRGRRARRRPPRSADPRAGVVMHATVTAPTMNDRSFRITARRTGRRSRPACAGALAGGIRAARRDICTSHRGGSGRARCSARDRRAEALIARLDGEFSEMHRIRVVFSYLLDVHGPPGPVVGGPFRPSANTGAPASAARCSARSPRSPVRAAAAASSGRSSTGTRRRSGSTNRSAPACMPDWRIARVTGDALARLAEDPAAGGIPSHPKPSVD